jgi:hypothetical protein
VSLNNESISSKGMPFVSGKYAKKNVKKKAAIAA